MIIDLLYFYIWYFSSFVMRLYLLDALPWSFPFVLLWTHLYSSDFADLTCMKRTHVFTQNFEQRFIGSIYGCCCFYWRFCTPPLINICVSYSYISIFSIDSWIHVNLLIKCNSQYFLQIPYLWRLFVFIAAPFCLVFRLCLVTDSYSCFLSDSHFMHTSLSDSHFNAHQFE